MDWNDIGQITWSVLNSPAVIALLAGGLLWLLNRIYAARPAWQAFEGTIRPSNGRRGRCETTHRTRR